MIIDIHGHYTTAPKELEAWRDRQLAGLADAARTLSAPKPDISDDQIRETIATGQLKQILERGGNITLFSPRRPRHQMCQRAAAATCSYLASYHVLPTLASTASSTRIALRSCSLA